MKKVILTTVILLLTISNLFSQTNEVGKKYIYEFRDGTTIIGTFDREEKGNVYIKDLEGKEVYIPSVMIAQRHEVTNDNLRDGEYWFSNLHDTRYFFAPSAFGLEAGEGYFNNIYYLYWQAQYGITDELSIGGGTFFLGPSSLNMKYSYNLGKDLNMAMGYFWIGSLFWNDEIETFVSMPFVVGTTGSKENNFTLGIGYNFLEGSATLNIGGTFRASRRLSFIAEAWVFNFEDGTIMGGPGMRYFRKINRVTARNGAGAKTFDFQLLVSPDMDGIIPMFGASQKF